MFTEVRKTHIECHEPDPGLEDSTSYVTASEFVRKFDSNLVLFQFLPEDLPEAIDPSLLDFGQDTEIEDDLFKCIRLASSKETSAR